jgi:hypothetical protein
LGAIRQGVEMVRPKEALTIRQVSFRGPNHVRQPSEGPIPIRHVRLIRQAIHLLTYSPLDQVYEPVSS